MLTFDFTCRTDIPMKKSITLLAIFALSISALSQTRHTETIDALYGSDLNAVGKQTQSYYYDEDEDKILDGPLKFSGRNDYNSYNLSGTFTYKLSAGTKDGCLNGNYSQSASYNLKMRLEPFVFTTSLSGTFLNGEPNGTFRVHNGWERVPTEVNVTMKNGHFVGAYSLCYGLRRYKGNLTQDGKLTGTWTIKDEDRLNTLTMNFYKDVDISGSDKKMKLAKDFADGKITEEDLLEQGFTVGERSLYLGAATNAIRNSEHGLLQTGAYYDFSEYNYSKRFYCLYHVETVSDSDFNTWFEAFKRDPVSGTGSRFNSNEYGTYLYNNESVYFTGTQLKSMYAVIDSYTLEIYLAKYFPEDADMLKAFRLDEERCKEIIKKDLLKYDKHIRYINDLLYVLKLSEDGSCYELNSCIYNHPFKFDSDSVKTLQELMRFYKNVIKQAREERIRYNTEVSERKTAVDSKLNGREAEFFRHRFFNSYNQQYSDSDIHFIEKFETLLSNKEKIENNNHTLNTSCRADVVKHYSKKYKEYTKKRIQATDDAKLDNAVKMTEEVIATQDKIQTMDSLLRRVTDLHDIIVSCSGKEYADVPKSLKPGYSLMTSIPQMTLDQYDQYLELLEKYIAFEDGALTFVGIRKEITKADAEKRLELKSDKKLLKAYSSMFSSQSLLWDNSITAEENNNHLQEVLQAIKDFR